MDPLFVFKLLLHGRKAYQHATGPEGRKPVGPWTIAFAILGTFAFIGYMAYRLIATR